jgi:hypothetical protein
MIMLMLAAITRTMMPKVDRRAKTTVTAVVAKKMLTRILPANKVTILATLMGPILEKCAICLKRLRNQKIGTPESCDHSFCLDCITEWSKVRDMHADEPVFDNSVVLCNLP